MMKPRKPVFVAVFKILTPFNFNDLIKSTAWSRNGKTESAVSGHIGTLNLLLLLF